MWCVALNLATFVASPREAYAISLSDGAYHLNISAHQATQEQLSMCDGALENPALLTVEGSRATLEFSLQPVKMGAIDGYLGIVQYFPGWASSSAPDEESAADAAVVATYKSVKDEYNNAKSKDALMKGVAYPKTVSIEWDTEAVEGYLRVYVPVMNAISEGSGWQLVRLRADYDSLNRVDGGEGEGSSSSSSSSEGSDDGETGEHNTPSSSSSSASSSSKGETRSSAASSSSSSSASSSKTNDPSKSSTKSSSSSHEGSSTSSSASAEEPLDFKDLPDGAYTIGATLVKIDRETLSMGDAAIDHTLELHASKGSYRLNMKLGQVSFAGQASYLGTLRYFKTGYGTDEYGAPTGATAACEVMSYHTQDGKNLTDNYGTDYPAEVRIPVIPEAKEDGFIPLQAFVPIMDSIAAGTGTQAMYLKLDTASIARAGENSPGASRSSSSTDDNSNSGNGTGTGNQNASQGGQSSGGNVISGNTLPSGGSNAITGVSSQANTTKSTTASQLKQNGSASSTKSTSSSTAASASRSTASASNSVSVTPLSTVASADANNSATDEKQPPLKGAALPIGVAGGAAIALGVGGTLVRRRESLFDEEL